MNTYIKADRFLLKTKVHYNQYLKIEDGYFRSFVDSPPVDAKVLDWTGYTIAPGLFDSHIHGINGYDIMDGTTEAVHSISTALLSLGVTRFLPTTLTSSQSDLDQAITAVRDAVSEGLRGAQSEGIFLEGPYFTEEHKGAQNSSYFRDPDIDEFMHWQKLSNNTIVKIALAPERQGSLEFIQAVSQQGVLVGLAHTDAGYDDSVHAIDAGASNIVHLFNGMSGLHHREPGVVGAALRDDRAFVELICDGYHVHPDVAMLAERLKGKNLSLITDCMRAGLKPDGNYRLGDLPVIIQNGIARTETGSLAGSTLKLIDAVKNLSHWSRKPLHEIWHRASLSPAASIGVDERLGSIAPGKVADYVVLNDENGVQATAVAGEIQYQKQDRN